MARPRGGCDRPRVALVLEPLRRETDKIDRRQARDGDTRGEKVVGDEPPHRRADAPLVFRHDGGMGDRQPEGTAKKRDDGEPVGAGANHAGFGEGAEVRRPDPSRRRAPHGEIDRRHQNEQQRGDRAHPAQFRPTLGLGFEGVGRSERRGSAGRGSSKLCHRKVALVQSDLRNRSAIIGIGHAPAIGPFDAGGSPSASRTALSGFRQMRDSSPQANPRH